MEPLVVVVQGPPAAGKTTVAHEVASRLRLPLIAKDTIKEALFDGLGAGDLEWSRRLGEATYLAMLALVEESVVGGGSLVLERNFVRGSEFAARLAALPARFVQVHCSAPLELLLERYRSRERHPGHVDNESQRSGPPSRQDATTHSSYRARRSASTRAARSTWQSWPRRSPSWLPNRRAPRLAA
ncbi:MAG: AAA family ATPase [Gaiellaceae bacterium]